MAHAKGETLVYASSADPDSLDPANAQGNPSEVANRMIYDNLVRFDEKLKLLPGLATEWKQAEDGMSWTFTLRQGVTFHDGTPFNAEAVKVFFERWIGPEKPSRANLFTPYLQSVEIQGDYSIKVNLKRPFAFFINNVAHSSSGIVSPAALKKYGKDIKRNPVGTGPFKFQEWVVGDHLTVVRNDAYWAGKPKLAKIIVKTVKESSGRVMMLQSGDADLIVKVPSEDIPRLKKDSKVILDTTETLKVLFLGINNAKKPFTDVRVRQALAYAIDKEILAQAIYQGRAEAVPSIVAPLTTGYVPVKGLGSDVQKAKKLLAEAGFPNGFKTTLLCPQGRYPKDFELAQALQQQFKKIGVDVSVQAMEWAAYLAAWRNTGKPPEEDNVDLFLMGWSPSTAEVAWTFNVLFSSGGPKPLRYANKELDEMVDKFGRATTSEEMHKYGKMAQELVADTVPLVPIVKIEETIGYCKDLEGIINSPLELTYADHRTCFKK
jgi:ABC-type transport system substrate-binding protein